jgi:ParB family chromosome partitioning protein
MDLELHQLDRRYEALRTRSAAREKRLLGSLSEIGQQTPIVVVRDGERFVVVDGYKRLRALRRLGHDTVRAVEWALSEAEALLLERILRSADGYSAIEQGWFLRELFERFGLGLDELARRFDRSKSWVSRRVALVAELPAGVQEHVRSGAIGGHAAMKYLVPLARANAEHCSRLADALAGERPTSRQVAELYATYAAGNAATRELVVKDPRLVLRARTELEREGPGATPVEHLLDDLRIVGAVARRARARVRRGALDDASAGERQRVPEGCSEAHGEVSRLKQHCERELGTKESNDARSIDTVGDSQTT